jgi:cell division protein FtsI/penicillin-binding protein 2
MATSPKWSNQVDEWRNPAVEAIAPGSIYKIVSWLAKAQTTIPSDKVRCNGHGEQDYGIHCWNWQGHGEVDGLEALVQSCNRWFTNDPNGYPSGELTQTARALGLIGKSGHGDGLDQEQSGVLFRQIESPVARALSSIGQMDVRISPLAAANLMVTILHHGKGFRPRAVKKISYQNGITKQVVAIQRLDHPLTRHPMIWRALQGALRQSVKSGTANALKEMEAPPEWKRQVLGTDHELLVAAKTGTAQVSTTHHQTSNGEQVVMEAIVAEHHWLVGYFPAIRPIAAFAIVIRNEPVHSNARTFAVFRAFVEEFRALSSQKDAGNAN